MFLVFIWSVGCCIIYLIEIGKWNEGDVLRLEEDGDCYGY